MHVYILQVGLPDAEIGKIIVMKLSIQIHKEIYGISPCISGFSRVAFSQR